MEWEAEWGLGTRCPQVLIKTNKREQPGSAAAARAVTDVAEAGPLLVSVDASGERTFQSFNKEEGTIVEEGANDCNPQLSLSSRRSGVGGERNRTGGIRSEEEIQRVFIACPSAADQKSDLTQACRWLQGAGYQIASNLIPSTSPGQAQYSSLLPPFRASPLRLQCSMQGTWRVRQSRRLLFFFSPGAVGGSLRRCLRIQHGRKLSRRRFTTRAGRDGWSTVGTNSRRTVPLLARARHRDSILQRLLRFTLVFHATSAGAMCLGKIRHSILLPSTLG
jgi:hypothetical protein